MLHLSCFRLLGYGNIALFRTVLWLAWSPGLGQNTSSRGLFSKKNYVLLSNFFSSSNISFFRLFLANTCKKNRGSPCLFKRKRRIYFAIKLSLREISYVLYVHALMTRKSCAVEMCNAILRNYVNWLNCFILEVHYSEKLNSITVITCYGRHNSVRGVMLAAWELLKIKYTPNIQYLFYTLPTSLTKPNDIEKNVALMQKPETKSPQPQNSLLRSVLKGWSP